MHIDFIFKTWNPAVFPDGKVSPHTCSRPTSTTWNQIKAEHQLPGHRFRAVRREWPAWAWPGGYPVFYVTKDGGVLCPDCANRNLLLTLEGDAQWRIVASEINYEDQDLTCDHCGKTIQAAYTKE